MVESLEISCPNCGMSLQVPLDKVPEDGAWGKCTACGHRLFLERPAPSPPSEDDAPPLSDDTWAPPPEGSAPTVSLEADKDAEAESPSAFFLKTPEGETVRLQTQKIADRIHSQRVLPWDLVSSDGERFEPIQKHPDFGELFREHVVVVRRECWNHFGKVAEKICARCQRCYCGDCLPPPAQEGLSHRVCSACGGVLQDTDPGWRLRPYWRRTREVLLFPRGKAAWLATGGLGVVLWVASLSWILTPLYWLAFFFLVYVLLNSAKGNRGLQEMLKAKPEGAEIVEIAERSLLAMAVTFLIAAPFVLINTFLPVLLASALTFFLGLAAFAYHPMALGIALLTEKPFAAFKPKVVVRQIQVMDVDYPSLLLGLLLMDAVLFITLWIVGNIPLLGGPLAKVLLAYGLIVEAHMVGWTFYLNLARLGWRRPLVV